LASRPTAKASSRLSSKIVCRSSPTGLPAVLFRDSRVRCHQKTCRGDNPSFSEQHSTRCSILDPTDVPKVPFMDGLYSSPWFPCCVTEAVHAPQSTVVVQRWYQGALQQEGSRLTVLPHYSCKRLCCTTAQEPAAFAIRGAIRYRRYQRYCHRETHARLNNGTRIIIMLTKCSIVGSSNLARDSQLFGELLCTHNSLCSCNTKSAKRSLTIG